MKLKKILKPTNRKLKFKKFFYFLLILLIPNLLRQIIYFTTKLLTNSSRFIVSYETVLIFSQPTFPWLGLAEELLIGLVFAFLWFKFTRLRFLCYAWITDALFDFLSTLSYIFFNKTILEFFGLNPLSRFFLREVVLFYLILGPLLYWSKVNIKKLSITYSIIGLLILAYVSYQLLF